MDMPQEDNVNIFVVADDAERQILEAELNDRPITDSEIIQPEIFDYSMLLGHLRGVGGRQWLQRSSITIVGEIDHHYSATFALSILEVVQWLKLSSNEAMFRFLTISALEQPEEPIQRVVEFFYPGLMISLVDCPNQVSTNFVRAEHLKWTDGEFVEVSAYLIQKQVDRRRTSMVFCHSEEARYIMARLKALNTPIRAVFADDRSVEVILQILRDPNDTKMLPVVFFLTKYTQLPMIIFRLGAILISHRRAAPLWEYGRIVNTIEPVSECEMARITSYLWQTSTPMEMVTILAPEKSSLRRLPRRRVDNDHGMTFLVDIFANFKDMGIHDVQYCFISDYAIMETNLMQLVRMECFGPHDGNGRLLHIATGIRSETLLGLLPILEYKFLPSWFLACGLVSPQATESAKRAMIRLAAIIHEGLGVIHEGGVFWSGVSSTEKMAALDVFANKIAEQFDMPSSIFRQGGLWVALAAWHTLSMKMRGFEAGMSLTGDADIMKDIAPPRGIIFLNSTRAERIQRTVVKLESFAGLESLNERLVLTEVDCIAIQDVMIQTWMHQTICIFADPKEDQVPDDEEDEEDKAIEYKFVDLVVGTTSGMHPSIWSLIPIDGVMGSRGTTSNIMIVAALSFNVSLHPSFGTLFGGCVVLPEDRIRAWQDLGEDREFAKDIRYLREVNY